MLEALSARWSFFKGTASRWRVVTTGVVFLFGAATLIRDEFLPDEITAQYRVVELLPSWPWWGWGIAGLFTLLIWVAEGGFRESQAKQQAIDDLGHELRSKGPRLKGCIDGVMSGSHDGKPMVGFLVGIRNSGAPSIAESFRLYLREPDRLDREYWKTHFEGMLPYKIADGESALIDCDKSDLVLNAAPNPIGTGALVRGFLFCYTDEGVNLKGWTITVRFKDSTGKMNYCEQTLTPKTLAKRVDTFPGIVVRRAE